jgi:hypothetical protein
MQRALTRVAISDCVGRTRGVSDLSVENAFKISTSNICLQSTLTNECSKTFVVLFNEDHISEGAMDKSLIELLAWMSMTDYR